MYESDVAKNVDLPDGELNPVIEEYIAGDNYPGDCTTAAAWRVEHYTSLRRWAYPDITEYNDAKVKINSGDSAMIAEGETQLSQYYTDCLAVKARFPKAYEE